MNIDTFVSLAEKYVMIARDLKTCRTELFKHSEVLGRLERNIALLSVDLSLELGPYGYAVKHCDTAQEAMRLALSECRNSLAACRIARDREQKNVDVLEAQMTQLLAEVTSA